MNKRHYISQHQQERYDILISIAVSVSGIPRDVIESSTRRRPLPFIRYMVMYRLHQEGYSLRRIEMLTARTRAAVVHGIRQIEIARKRPSEWSEFPMLERFYQVVTDYDEFRQ